MDNEKEVEKMERLILGLAGKRWSWESIAKDTLAAVQVAPMEFVKPKPLVWYDTAHNNYAAKGLGGEYLIESRGHGKSESWLWWTPTFRGRGTKADTLEAAQAAAFEDLCNRVKELF